jgi:uncharacterized protein YndB with AHSA1/START domain
MSSSTTRIAPVVRTIETRLPRGEAFTLFTAGIGTWWPRDRHSVSQARCVSVAFEPREGGTLYEVRDDGERFPWGRVLRWDPPRLFVMSWYPGEREESATEVEVRFDALDRGTRVTLEHRNWERRGDAAAAIRENYAEGWVGVLDDYRRRADG